MDGSSTEDRVYPLTVTRRLQREGRWRDIEPERDEMMKLARKRGMPKSEAQASVYAELDRLFPPLEKRTVSYSEGSGSDSENRTESHSGGQIQEFGEIPEDWPELPANASLGTEIGWVQANRLRIVEERTAGATIVHLGRALSPAPSWAALDWLETSIRSYAKYVDVAAKATAGGNGEAEVWKRERMGLEEAQALLNEMMENDDGEG